MSNYDNGFARAQAAYDRQEQPDHSQDLCACGTVYEDHPPGPCDNCGCAEERHPVDVDGERCTDYMNEEPACPNGSGVFREAEEREPDPDRFRNER